MNILKRIMLWFITEEDNQPNNKKEEENTLDPNLWSMFNKETGG